MNILVATNRQKMANAYTDSQERMHSCSLSAYEAVHVFYPCLSRQLTIMSWGQLVTLVHQRQHNAKSLLVKDAITVACPRLIGVCNTNIEVARQLKNHFWYFHHDQPIPTQFVAPCRKLKNGMTDIGCKNTLSVLARLSVWIHFWLV